MVDNNNKLTYFKKYQCGNENTNCYHIDISLSPGFDECWSIKDSFSEETINDSIHYSGIYLINGKMIEDNQQMPLPGIDFTEGIGNNGQGTIRITFLSSIYICKWYSIPY